MLRAFVWTLAVLAIPVFAVQKGTRWIQRAAGFPAGSELLRLAATDGNLNGIRDALSDGASVNEADAEGFTALHCATMAKHPQIVRTLLNAGANIRAESTRGTTPFSLAVALEAHEITRIYLEAGIDPNEPLSCGATPLYLACINGDEQTIAMLLHAGAKVNLASASGSTPLVACVCAADHAPAVTLQLLAAGADINAADNDGFTALMNAAIRNEVELVQILLDHGANPQQQNHAGRTARELAEQEQCFETAKMLAAIPSFREFVKGDAYQK
jgi:ankyrin repeat protein